MQRTNRMCRGEESLPLLQEGRPLSGDRVEGVAGLQPSPHRPQCAVEAVAGLGGVEQGASCRCLSQEAPGQGRSGFGPEMA